MEEKGKKVDQKDQASAEADFTREDYILLTNLAQQSERYPEMIEFV